jgi:hypothetical protein
MILRTIVLIIAIIAFAGALTGTLVDPGVWPSLLFTSILFIGVALERARYRAAQRRPVDGAWCETAERSIDDDSGRPVTVWFDPATNARRYVDSDGAEEP